LLSFALAASNDQRMLALLLGLAAGFNVLANLWLIPRLGASGAALTTLWTEGGVALLLSLRLAWTYRNL
ncbi:MAG: polysaccharide biosynthesis C-terminal domain-containing protein, partial [Bacteroidota bacterium]